MKRKPTKSIAIKPRPSKLFQTSALARVRKLFPNVTSVTDAGQDIDIHVIKADTNTAAVKNQDTTLGQGMAIARWRAAMVKT